MLAATTGVVQPSDADVIAFLELRNAGADGCHDSGTLVTRNEGRYWLHRPITVRCVQIGVAYAGRHDFHQDFTRAGEGTATSSIRSGFPNSLTTAAFIVFAIAFASTPFCVLNAEPR
jgi:hypothetical protein